VAKEDISLNELKVLAKEDKSIRPIQGIISSFLGKPWEIIIAKELPECTKAEQLLRFAGVRNSIKKARKTNLSEDWERYRCLRNCVTNKIKVAKGCYNRQLIEENSGDPKAFWKTLRRLKTSKAVGLDDIPPRLLKDAAHIVTKPLTVIINASLHQAKVPVEWKSARVIPLFKKGDVNNMDNYRPISILPIASKLLERAVHTQLVTYIQEHNLLSL
ncbi:Hypothetical predicted protein, partial [Paramuricea clavata]